MPDRLAKIKALRERTLTLGGVREDVCQVCPCEWCADERQLAEEVAWLLEENERLRAAATAAVAAIRHGASGAAKSLLVKATR